MRKTCVIIEGELRTGRRCGPNIRNYAVDALNTVITLNSETGSGFSPA